jgi:hypothetical protein
MNDLRLLARFEHELEGGPAKKGEAQIIVVSVNVPRLKKLSRNAAR